MSDRKLVAVVLLIVAASGAYVHANYYAAFPQASLTLPLSRNQITEAAEKFLAGRKLSTAGFRGLTLFDPDEEARLYLERELGLEQANRLMESQAPVWRWRARWFKPPEKEELVVHLRPDGSLVGFEHRIPETDKGERLEPAAAREIAQAFLGQQTSQPHKLIAEQREARPNRDDHVFTWEQENFKAKDATIRRTVVIHGSVVGSYREFLYVPEQWQRDFATLRSSNELYAGIAQGFYMLLTVASLGLLVNGLRRREIPWRPLIRIAGAVAAFYFANELNTLPFALDGMQTSTPFPQMALLALLAAIGSAVGVLIYVLVPAAAGAGLFSRVFGHLGQIESAFNRGLGTRSFFRASVAGFGMAAAHLSFLTAFYLLGAKVGVWSPAEVSYSDVLATPIPWVYPVAIALMASSAEEFWFRLLAIPLVQKLVRVRFLAVVIPAFVWGFLHANYPQQPGWIRGVEVGSIGVAAGYMMLEFGIVATLVWHYVIDASLIGMFLFQAHAWTYRMNGLILAVAILSPLIVSLVLYRRHHGFLPEPEAAAPVEEAPPEPEEPLADALPAPWPQRYLWIAAAVAGLVALVARPVVYGDFIRVSQTREQAIAQAEGELRRRNLNPADWRVSADFAPNLRVTDFEYLRQKAGPAKANEIFRERMIYGVWRVRYFKPLSPEEWIFYIDSRNRLYRFDHELDEKAAGAQLEREDAERAAVTEIARQGIHGFRLVDSQTDKLDHRTDHSFVWEDPAFELGEARFRVALQMVGDEACEFRRFFKLPEQWLRDFSKPTLATYVVPAFFGSTAVPLILLLVRRLGMAGHRFHWKVYAALAGVAVVLGLANEANGWPSFYRGYDTSIPLMSFWGQTAIGSLTRLLMAAAGTFGAALAADSFLQMVAPARRLPAFSWQRAVAVAVLLAAAGQITAWLLGQMPGPRTKLPLWGIGGMDAFLPSVDAFLEDLPAAFLAVAGGAVYVCGVLAMFDRRRMAWALGVAALTGALGYTITPVQLPFTLLAASLWLGAVILIVMTCATDVASVFGGVLLLLSASGAWRMMEQPAAWLRGNGAALLVLAAVALYVISRLTPAAGRK